LAVGGVTETHPTVSSPNRVLRQLVGATMSKRRRRGGSAQPVDGGDLEEPASKSRKVVDKTSVSLEDPEQKRPLVFAATSCGICAADPKACACLKSF
jgi:hypothetical protein